MVQEAGPRGLRDVRVIRVLDGRKQVCFRPPAVVRVEPVGAAAHLQAFAGLREMVRALNWTGGGEIVMMKASLMLLKRAIKSRWRRSALRPCSNRSSNGAMAEKMAPPLDALVKVAPSKPAKGTAWSMPSVSRMILVASRTTASVRDRDDPGGSWITVIR